MSDIALTVSMLALVAVVGLWIGNVKIRGVVLGLVACFSAVLSSAILLIRLGLP